MAAQAPPPLVRLEVVSRVGCVWCDRLEGKLRAAGPEVQWTESARLDPTQHDYAAKRDALLARAGGSHKTFPFVFDADSGAFVGGHDAALEYIALRKACAFSEEEHPFDF
jgi:glutaredoxin